jgi:hypothetical protein
MPDDADILRLVNEAFAGCARPAHFTDHTHCEECADHDELLRSRDRETLRLEDVGNPGWDPMCFVTDAGFGYYFPALARLALAAPEEELDWYPRQLLFHLTYDGQANRHRRSLTPDQRGAVAALLRHLSETRPRLVEANGCADELRLAIDLWSRSGPAA